jgi:hypothetical protein
MDDLESRLDNIAERLLDVARNQEEYHLSTDARTLARDTHNKLTTGVPLAKLRQREYVLTALLAGFREPVPHVDAHLIERISGLRRATRTLDSLRTILTNFGERDYFSTMLGFSIEHVQEDPRVQGYGKCFVCPETPNAVLLLKDPRTGMVFSMGFECYNTVMTALSPESGTPADNELGEYTRKAQERVDRIIPLAKSLSAREKQRIAEFDAFVASLKDPPVLNKALRQAKQVDPERYRELDAQFWRDIGKLMETAAQLHDISIATAIAEPKRGWYGMLASFIDEGANPLLQELVDEQRAALYTPALGRQLFLYHEILSRTTGGWRNVAGDIIEEVHHERAGRRLSPAQLRVYASISLLQQIEAAMLPQGDATCFSEEHRIPYRDLLALLAVYEGGTRKERIRKNKETLAAYESRGVRLYESMQLLGTLAKARILSTAIPQSNNNYRDAKWRVRSHRHLTASDHDLVRSLEDRWTLRLPNTHQETVLDHAVQLEPAYRFVEIMERIATIMSSTYPVGEQLEQRISRAGTFAQNPYLLLEPKVQQRIARLQGMQTMTPKGELILQKAEAWIDPRVQELAREKRTLHYTFPGVDITSKTVQEQFAAYEGHAGQRVAFLHQGTALVHEFDVAKISTNEYVDARVVCAAVAGAQDAVQVRALKDQQILEKAKYLGKTPQALLRFAQRDIHTASDLVSLTEDSLVSSSLGLSIKNAYDAVLVGEKKVLSVVQNKDSYAQILQEHQEGSVSGMVRIIAVTPLDSIETAYLRTLGFVPTQRRNMMRRGSKHQLSELLVQLAQHNESAEHPLKVLVYAS